MFAVRDRIWSRFHNSWHPGSKHSSLARPELSSSLKAVAFYWLNYTDNFQIGTSAIFEMPCAERNTTPAQFDAHTPSVWFSNLRDEYESYTVPYKGRVCDSSGTFPDPEIEPRWRLLCCVITERKKEHCIYKAQNSICLLTGSGMTGRADTQWHFLRTTRYIILPHPESCW